MDQVSQPWTKEVSGGAQDCCGYDLQQGKNAVAPREEVWRSYKRSLEMIEPMLGDGQGWGSCTQGGEISWWFPTMHELVEA